MGCKTNTQQKIPNNSFTNLSPSNFTSLIFCVDSFQNKRPRFVPDAFIMAAAKQAIKFSPALKEIRLHLCQKSAASAGVRSFMEKHYVPLKLANPKFPFLVRECSGITPKLWARFGYGREESVDLSNKTDADILTELEKFK